MTSKPIVAVVGRPNVGKSTFFNRMAGKRLAIVEDTPGVTRDRIYADVEWCGRTFTLVDTGGIEPHSDEKLFVAMRRQAQLAIDTARVILFFVDAIEGLVATDREVADLLRRSQKEIILVVNKADRAELELNAYDFYALGLGEPVCISAQQALGLGDLLDRVVACFDGEVDTEPAQEDPEHVSIAVVGKPNAGKSSLVNRLLNEERSIVSDIAGTTRDAIDTDFTNEQGSFTLIDTAGIRRKRAIEENSIERYSIVRALDAVRRSDVCLCLIDASEGITEQDTKIAGFVHEEGKACLIVVNKWDLIEKDTGTMREFDNRIKTALAFMDYADILYISAKTGQRTDKLLPMVKRIKANAQRRITTGLLNDVLHDAMNLTEPPTDKGRRLKVFFASQVSVAPPTFVLFVNDVKLMHYSYKRYLENYLRKSFDFSGTPIRLIVREKDKKEQS
ncbi:MAG: ribosome biogenesis GTPase Der [Eubacteriales bacterium]|nr:ribosome biogenesis GTPase Der [Eubacteriales bacterium]